MVIFTETLKKEVDVLCGRGNGINNMPGNVKFRRLVDHYRPAYNAAARLHKSAIANKIVDAVHDSGGRFLSFDPSIHDWVEVPIKKAVEKACQAMREEVKHGRRKSTQLFEKKISPPSEKVRQSLHQNNKKSKPETSTTITTTTATTATATTTPYVDNPKTAAMKSKDFKSPPQQQPPAWSDHEMTNTTTLQTNKSLLSNTTTASTLPRQGRRELQSDNTSNHQKQDSIYPPFSSRLLRRHFLSSTGAAPQDVLEIQQLTKQIQQTPIVPSSERKTSQPPLYSMAPYRRESIDNDSWERLFDVLLEYRSTFGHTAVPPSWAGDQELATWTSLQRQLFRETVITGHRIANTLESERIKRLQSIDFVWDYSDWHWEKSFKLLKQLFLTPSKAISGILLDWLEKQEDSMHQGRLVKEKCEKVRFLLDLRDKEAENCGMLLI